MQRISFVRNKMVLEILQRKTQAPGEPLRHESRCPQIFSLEGEECPKDMWISQFGVHVLNARIKLDAIISFITLNNSVMLKLFCSQEPSCKAVNLRSMQIVICRWDCLSMSKMLNTFKKKEKERGKNLHLKRKS